MLGQIGKVGVRRYAAVRIWFGKSRLPFVKIFWVFFSGRFTLDGVRPGTL